MKKKGIHRDIKTAREIIKEKRTGGLDVDVSIDHDMVVNPGKYVDLLVKAPENGVWKMSKNVWLFIIAVVCLTGGSFFLVYIEKRIKALGGFDSFDGRGKYIYRQWRCFGWYFIACGVISFFLLLTP